MASAVCLLGFTGCSSIDAGTGRAFQNAFIERMDPQPDDDIVAAEPRLVPDETLATGARIKGSDLNLSAIGIMS